MQLYFYDTDESIRHRIQRSPNLDDGLIRIVLRILDDNPYVCEEFVIDFYVLTDKDKLAIDFARNLLEKTILVEIYPEFLYQKHIRCLLDPTIFLTDVVNISTMHISYFT
jgi:hypothetical protein